MRDFYRTPDNQYVTDVDPYASDLWVVIGPGPLFTDDIDPLPSGWRWLDAAEWAPWSWSELTAAEAKTAQVD